MKFNNIILCTLPRSWGDPYSNSTGLTYFLLNRTRLLIPFHKPDIYICVTLTLISKFTGVHQLLDYSPKVYDVPELQHLNFYTAKMS